MIALQKAAATATSWKDVPKEDMDRMVSILEQKRLLVKKGIRTKPLSQLHTVRQVHKRIDEEVSEICAGISSNLLTKLIYTVDPAWAHMQNILVPRHRSHRVPPYLSSHVERRSYFKGLRQDCAWLGY